MPLYEYRCENCGQQFEVMQKFSDAPLTTHEACGGKVNRLLSAPALQFKGSGWYITDYAKGSSAGSPSSNTSGNSGDNGAKKSESTTPASSATPSTTTSSSSDKK